MLPLAIILLPLLANIASAGEQWVYLGCYGDRMDSRTLPNYYQSFSYPSQGEGGDFKPMFDICRQAAEKKGFIYFGMQHKEECWGSKEGDHIAKYGKVETCATGADGYHIGLDNTNAIWAVKVDGGFSKWSPWSACGKSCGHATQERMRTCTAPEPRGIGKKCSGPAKETRKCSLPPCTVEGGWSKFSSWSKDCSKTCGGGVRIRTRCCTNSPPSARGGGCHGESYEIRGCNEQSCSVDGGWSSYGQWGKCSVQCGGGTQERVRSCTSPPPSRGGKPCSGSNRDTRSCTGTECEVGTQKNPGRSCNHIKAEGITESGRYFITLAGKTFEVFCDQTTDGGGWTLVYSYTFTDFNNFRKGSNAITPRPNWPAPGNVPVSTTPPKSETDYNALDFNLWKQLGTEFMIKSNINNWISCREGSGSLINWRNGGLHCRLVNNYTHKCGNVVPNTIKMRIHDSYGWHELGPNLLDSRVRGWGVIKTYYYLETSTKGVNWPTHDPCGKNQLNHLRSSNPHGNIYVRSVTE